MCFNATQISSMDVTIFFLNVDMITKTCKMWLWQEVSDPQLQSQLQEVNNPQYLNEIITIWRKEFTLNPKKPNSIDDKNRCRPNGNLFKLSWAQ